MEHYLRAPPEFRDIAFIRSEYYTRNRDIVLIELAEARIAGYLIEGVSEGRPERLGKLSVEAEAGGGVINNEGDWVDTKSPAYEHWNWNWKKRLCHSQSHDGPQNMVMGTPVRCS